MSLKDNKYICLDLLSEAIFLNQEVPTDGTFKKGYEAGLKFYKSNYLHSLVDSLLRSYPAVHKILGEDNFKYFASQFMADFPSRSPNLDDYGKEFGKYLGMRSELNEIGYVEFIAELDWFWFHSEENSKSSIEIPKGILHLWDCISHDKEVRELAIDPDMEEKVTIGCDGESTYLIGGDDV